MYKVTNRSWNCNHTNLYKWAIEILSNGSLHYHVFNSQIKAKKDYKGIKTDSSSLISLIRGDFELDGKNQLHRYNQTKERVISRK